MTYLKTALVSCAAISIAAPAFAGDMKKKSYDAAAVTTETTVTMNAPDTKVMSATQTMMHPSKVNDTVGEVLQADGEMSIQSDRDVVVAGDETINVGVFNAADKDMGTKDNAIVVPGSNNAITTVMCPAGTTAQVDMTCLVTGEWIADLDG